MKPRNLLFSNTFGFIESIKSGLKIKNVNIWLDPPRKKPVAFISHAHSDHLRFSHTEAIVSLKTARFLQGKFRGKELTALQYEQKFEKAGATIELLPAGHILGSSQILIEISGTRIVYTGDIKLSPSYTAERIKIKPCDVLIMECTYGHPDYIFPDREDVANQLVSFVKDCFARKITPVVIAYKVGKAQEVVKILGDLGIKLRLEASVYEATEIYRELGINLINYKRYPPFVPHREVVVIPPGKFSLVKHIPRKKVAIVTGWALNQKKLERFHFDVAIPLSDHADFAELLSYVILAKPTKIYTVHGTPFFAEYLRKQGFNAVHLELPYVQPTLSGCI